MKPSPVSIPGDNTDKTDNNPWFQKRSRNHKVLMSRIHWEKSMAILLNEEMERCKDFVVNSEMENERH